MREPLIAGNWKMNCTIDEAVRLASSLRENLGSVAGVEVAVCPPFVDLHAVHGILQDTSVRLGAQDVFYKDSGAYTGAISAAMLRDLCTYVIVGHSERRHFFGDTDADVAAKVTAIQRAGIVPILCVGETLGEFESGSTSEVLLRQISSALETAAPAPDLVVAYEPVWAIGTGRSADPQTVAVTASQIRELLSRMWGTEIADGIRILYGGSVTAANIAGYVSLPEIDGALVGGASLHSSEFCDIVFNTAATVR
jgi:triosephosphate isomerase (TIM)